MSPLRRHRRRRRPPLLQTLRHRSRAPPRRRPLNLRRRPQTCGPLAAAQRRRRLRVPSRRRLRNVVRKGRFPWLRRRDLHRRHRLSGRRPRSWRRHRRARRQRRLLRLRSWCPRPAVPALQRRPPPNLPTHRLAAPCRHRRRLGPRSSRRFAPATVCGPWPRRSTASSIRTSCVVCRTPIRRSATSMSWRPGRKSCSHACRNRHLIAGRRCQKASLDREETKLPRNPLERKQGKHPK